MKTKNKLYKRLITATIILLMILPMVNAQKETTLNWHYSITFSGNNMNPILWFGESTNANDGQDTYDVPMPPMPPQPFLYAYFDSGLEEPYDKLMYDIKHYPDNYKVWNIKLLSSNGCNIVVNWEKVKGTEYKIVLLKDLETGNTVNMKEATNYEFEINSWSMYSLQIVCMFKTRFPYLVKKL